MIGNHLLDYRLMKDHQEQLLAEGQQRRRAHAAGLGRRHRSRRPRRSAAARLGARLEALGRRLQALDTRAAVRS